eukprot:594942-Pyramimonas_sp.AAC.1
MTPAPASDFLTIYSGSALPLETSSRFTQDPRSRLRLPHNLLKERRSRLGLPAQLSYVELS